MDKRKLNGGRRNGAGRPPAKTKRKNCSFRMDEDVDKILSLVGNKSQYINECIRRGV